MEKMPSESQLAYEVDLERGKAEERSGEKEERHSICYMYAMHSVDSNLFKLTATFNLQTKHHIRLNSHMTVTHVR